MTGKDITDAGMDYAFYAGRLAEKLERYNAEIEEFLAKYDIHPTPHRYLSDDVEEGKVSISVAAVASANKTTKEQNNNVNEPSYN